jgi:hypothetical protein
MASVETLGIHTINVPHTSGQVGIGGLDKEMIVVGHQTVGANPHIPHIRCFLQKFNKTMVISFFHENGLTTPPIHHMIPRPRILYS